jgi:hypothetical protein
MPIGDFGDDYDTFCIMTVLERPQNVEELMNPRRGKWIQSKYA